MTDGLDVSDCVFVCVWSFNDFWGKEYKGSGCVPLFQLKDEFFTALDTVIQLITHLFSKAVMICGGSAQTWDMKDSVFNTHSARVRERLRQSGVLVINPTDLYDSLPKREGDPWHFRCLSTYGRNRGSVDLAFISLEALVTHSVLIAKH